MAVTLKKLNVSNSQITSASYALTASYALNGEGGGSGLISSSVQLTNGQGFAFDDTSNVTFGSITSSALLMTGSIFLNKVPTFNTSSTEILVRNGTTGEVEYNLPSYLTAAKNVLRVGTSGSSGADFTSIKAAIDSITDASSTNPYVVQVRAGLYNEDPITMKSYVVVVGLNSTATIIQANSSSLTLINGADQSMIQDVQIQGCTGTGTAAVEYKSATTPQTNAIFYVENVRFGTNYTHARTVGTSGGNCIMQCSNVKYGGYNFTTGFHVTNDGSGIGRMQLRNVTSTNGGVATTTNLVFALADKPGCTFIVNGCLLTKATGTAAGTGFLAYDGASLRLTAVNFQRWAKAIYMPQSGSAPSIFGSALNFENDTLDIVVEHTGSTGKIDGSDNFLKTQINFSSSLYLVNKDARTITVAKKGGDFTSIKAAVDYITDSSETNRYIIHVGPGKYIEQQIDLTSKPYVVIKGDAIVATEIIASGSNQHVVKMGQYTTLDFLTIRNAGTGYAGIYVNDIGNWALVHKISMYDCDTNVFIGSATQDTYFYGEYIDYNGTYTYGTHVSASNGKVAFANMESYYQYPVGTAAISNEIVGDASYMNISTGQLTGDLTVGSVGIRMSDGANLDCSAFGISGYTYGLQTLNVGLSPTFDIVGGIFSDNGVYDFYVQHPTTQGRFQGSSAHTLINNSSSDFYWNFLDKIDGENDITGKLSITFSDGTHTDATTLIFKGSPMGVMQGGEITVSSGLIITTAAGFGYIQDSSNVNVYHRYDWNNTNLTLPPNSDCYIHIDDTGTLSYALSEVDYVTNIVLGRVITNATGIEIIEQIPYDGEHTANRLSEFNKKALGSVYSVGSIVTDSGSFKLNVTEGTYYFSENRFDPIGGNGISFTQYFRSASFWDRTVTSSVVHNVYDSGSSVLVPLSSSAYTKHTLYVSGDSVDEKYMVVVGQEQYPTLVEAENAGLPSPPSYFEYSIVPIASIYVRSGSSNIVQIEDIRPVIGFKASGVNASSVHGNLLGLTEDDHKQYLLISGTRAMDGNLNMGGHDISNAIVVTSNAFSGSLYGTSSWSEKSTSSSYATTASYIAVLTTTASWSTNAVTASYVTQSGYLYALHTSSQAISVANTWQTLLFERNQDISNWVHSINTGTFTSSLSATYRVKIATNIQKTAGTSATAATRFLLGTNEVTGSYTSYTYASNNAPQEIISEAILFVSSGSILTAQVAATTINFNVTPAISVGSPITLPSAKIFITKV